MRQDKHLDDADKKSYSSLPQELHIEIAQMYLLSIKEKQAREKPQLFIDLESMNKAIKQQGFILTS